MAILILGHSCIERYSPLKTLDYVLHVGLDIPLACDEADGWFSAAGKCYKSYGGTRTWLDAERYCNGVGGHLITINGVEEQVMAGTLAVTQQTSLWIGLSDTMTGIAGQYKWITDESLTYSYWGPDQPDNRYFTSGGDCVEIVGSANDGMWSTNVCTASKAFMCERPEGTCPVGWHLYRGYCYQFNSYDAQDWTTAKFTCEAQGTYLLTSLSAPENGFIVSQMLALTDLGIDTTWLGLSDKVTDGKFEWVEASSLTYTSWDQNQPNDRAQTEDCAYMTTGDGRGKWSTGSCTAKKSFVCKVIADQPISAIDPTVGIGTCDDGWTLNNQFCYFFDWIGRLYDAAEQNCVSKGAHLTSVVSQEEQNFLSMRARMGGAYQWIGLHDINTEGDFAWTDGSPVTFLNWAPGQPDNYYSVEDAVHFRSSELEAGLWNDIDGNAQYFASVCKKRSTNSIGYDPGVLPTPTFDARCGNGWDWDRTSENCYLFRFQDYRNWADAREYCRVQGGDLASITSAQEQAYINGRAQLTTESYTWVGGTDMNREGGWEWTDGSPLGFINWHQNEPNNAGSGEHCMQLFAQVGTWNDQFCDKTTGFICKKSGYLTTHFNIQPHRFSNGFSLRTLSNVYPNDCAPLCVQMTEFTCMAFNYNRLTRVCDLFNVATSTPMTDANMDYYQRLMDVADPVPTTLGPGYRCPSGWSGYGVSCYQAYSAQKLSYSGVQQQCAMVGGDLVSIHDDNENSYVRSLARESGVPDDEALWIGLNDLQTALTYQWQDFTPVDYTAWNAGQPDNHETDMEDCVEMDVTGYWNDVTCNLLRRGVCKRPMENLGSTLVPVTPVGCNLGETANGGSCYFVIDSAKSWQEALSDCQRFSPRGSLVAIGDRYEQSVLSSLLAPQDGSLFWIGLNDLDDQGEYSWSDDTPVDYTNWDYAHPDDSIGRCVASTSGILSGLWHNVDCSSPLKYMCERGRDGYPAPETVGPPTQSTPPSDSGCYDSRWKGYGGNCFMIVETEISGESRRSWEDAQMFCQAMGAELASFHSQDEEDYIVTFGNPNSGVPFWIGLHDKSIEGGFEWSDGSPVSHTNWHEGEPNNLANGIRGEDCTEMFFNGHDWNDQECIDLNNWVCKIPKNVRPTYTTAVPTTTTPWPACASDPDWLHYTVNNYCYFFSHGLGTGAAIKSWQESNEFCMQSGGYLVSIHSQEENDFIQSTLLRFGSSYTQTWIGLREYTTNGLLSWSDGSALDFVAWAPGEPNDYNGDEQCAEFYHPAGDWNDINCGQETYFVCRKPYGATLPITHPPTPEPLGNCLAGWLRFDNRCYRIYPDELMGWYDARDACRSMAHTDLVTVHSYALQAFLTAYSLGYPDDLWIGLHDTTISGRFYWTDGSTVDFTNWRQNEPSNGGGYEDCVVMLSAEMVTGKWNDLSCDHNRGYICQGSLDPNALAPDPVPTDCRDGFTEYNNACYQVLDLPYSFSQGQKVCQQLGDDVHLASVMSHYEEYFVESLAHISGKEPLWIGLYSVGGEFQWKSGWPVWYTFWSTNEPSAALGEGCVSVLPSGGWDDTACTTIYKPLCKYSLVPAPTEFPDVGGTCPDGWSGYGQNCYRVWNGGSDWYSWPEAEYRCSQVNASLASIHSSKEMEFIYNLMSQGSYDIFVGMTRGDQGGFVWSDGSPAEYTNWMSGEPSYPGMPGYEDCVMMYRATGVWNDISCFASYGYVCKQPKWNMKPPQEPYTGGGMDPGTIAGIIIASIVAVCLLGLVAFFVASRQQSAKTTSSMSMDVPGSVGFDNALYKAGPDPTIKVESAASVPGGGALDSTA